MINVLVPRRKGSSGDGSKSPATEPSPGTGTGGTKSSSSGFINASNTEATKEYSVIWESSEGTEEAPAMPTTATPKSIFRERLPASQNAVSDDTREVSTDATNSSNSDISNNKKNDNRNKGSDFGIRSSKNKTIVALNEPPKNPDGEDGRNENTKYNRSASESDPDSSSSDEGDEDNEDSNEGRQAPNQSRSNNFHDKLDRTLLERDILQSLGSHDELIDTKGLSDYELLRLRNIQRNERRMKELGLMTYGQNSVSGGVRSGSNGKRKEKMMKGGGVRSGSNGKRKEKMKERQKGIGTNEHVQQSPRTSNGNDSSSNLAENSGNNNRRKSAFHEKSLLALYYKTEQASPHAPKTAIHKRWMERYDELKSFYDTYGHIHVPSVKDCVASSTTAGRQLSGKSRNEEESKDVNSNEKSKTNVISNNYQYKALRTWLTKQKRQYLLYTQGEKSSMDEDKMKLMQQLGGKEWWKRIANGGGYVWVVGVGWKKSEDHRHSAASGSSRLRKYSDTRHSWSDEDDEEDGEMRKNMMQDFEEGDYDGDGDEDGDYSEYYEEERTLDDTDSISDWTSSSDINDGVEEEIGSVDSLDQESLEDSISHRTSLRRRSSRLRSGSRQMLRSFDDDNDSIHSTEDRLSSRSGSVQGDRYSSVKRSRMDDNSRASRVSYNSSSEDDESHFRRRKSRNKRKSPIRREPHNSFKETHEFPRDEYERKATRTRSKQRRIAEDARENRRSGSRSRSFSPSPVIRSRNHNSREPRTIRCRSPLPSSIRIGNSFSPTRSNRKRSSLEQIQGSDIEKNNHGGYNDSTFDDLRRERSSKKRQRENSTRQARREENYFSEHDPTKAVYRRNRKMFSERKHSIKYSDRTEYNVQQRNEIRASKRLRRHGDRYASDSPNRCSDSSTTSVSRDEMRIKPTGGHNSHQSNHLDHSHKPMNEITIAPKGQIQHNMPTINNVETTKNLLMAEFGRLYGKWNFILAKRNALRHEMSMLQSKIVIKSQVLCGSNTNEVASLGL
eukprot:CAMPEP_0171354734 /NCGR_PEP_ID=MMETSP0878-20121228/44857_1 /TAXON_ID=67004 /ORGANISM="Thalassiosira weissflogii, Strain CCMP1336" /LENGTH=1009 /DNA_ID=CAMNT_0011860715 /DNA_START=181 /DNA_END=3208 /DNA_ORIENTATION=-